MYHANGQQKKAGLAILIADNLDFKNKDCIKRCRRALHHNQGVYPSRRPNNCKHLCAKCVSTQIYKSITNKKKLIDSNTIILGDFNIPLTEMDRSSNQKINKETMALNDTLDQMDLTDIFRNFHPKAEHTFFSSAHGTSSRIDHILGHK